MKRTFIWMLSRFLPKPRAPLEYEYRRECNKNNLRYVWYFSVLACAVFTIHLLHHMRLGQEALNAEMMPYTLLYGFGIVYPAINMLALGRLQNLPALTPLANIMELIFPVFMAAISVILSVFGVMQSQGITPFAIMLLLICFLMQGHFLLCIGLVLTSFMALSVILLITFPADVATPLVVVAFTSALACLVVAYLAEKMHIRQFEIMAQLNASNRQLQQLSSQDHLTGILNRRSFDQILDKEMARSERFGHPLSLLLIDVDDFKTFNDTYGHLYGDQVLKRVSGVLKKFVRDVDVVGRMGGDEFVVLLIETEKQDAIQVADRMRKGVGHIPVSEGQQPISISIGHAAYQGESLSAFIERADKALYQAKHAGKNRVRSLLTEVPE